MGVVVKVIDANDDGHFVGGFRQEQQAANHGPFRLQAAGRLAVEQCVKLVGANDASLLSVDGGHVKIDPSLLNFETLSLLRSVKRASGRLRRQCKTDKMARRLECHLAGVSGATAGTTQTLS